MSTRTFAAPVSGAVVFALEASAVDVVINVSYDAEAASAELSGPAEVVDSARSITSRSASANSKWRLTLPRPRPVVIGNDTIINQVGGTVIIGDTMSIGGLSISGGHVQIGAIHGATVISTGAAAEPLTLTVTLPAGSQVRARIDAGKLTTHGYLPVVELDGISADADIAGVGALRVRTVSGDIEVGHVAGTADLYSTSGAIDVRNTAGNVTAETVSGAIAIRAVSDITVNATSVSGDITVRVARGTYPDVRARSVSGEVRTTSERN